MSIIDGAENILAVWLGIQDIGKAPHYRHGAACTRVARSTALNGDTLDVIKGLVAMIEQNWTGQRSTAQKNWIFRQEFSWVDVPHQQLEVILERQVVLDPARRWANQIPTASGLAGSGSDRRRAVDLAYQHGEREYTLFELKVDSDTPLLAATEILLHGMLYIFTRKHLHELGYDQHAFKLLGANIMHLRVLAPRAYYGALDLRMLESAVNDGLSRYCATDLQFDLSMDFRFEAFPLQFNAAEHRGASRLPALSNAFLERRPVYGL